jgi:HD-GYP domain-containing protein (c-di-GMP phosphodiesterase class II)
MSDESSPNSAAVARWEQWRALGQKVSPILLNPSLCENFVRDVDECAATLMRLLREDPDMGIFEVVHLSHVKMSQYGVIHSMHTAVLVCLVGRRKDWPDQRVATAVKAALTMNLSITELQSTLARQEEPLTPEQKLAINCHPLDSWQILRRMGVTDDEWLRAVAQHHEQPDGKGYPQGLTDMSQVADAVRTCDVFGAKMSPRASRTAMLSTRAAAEIFRQRSAGYFGATIIRELGLYPPGCLVRLASGEAALVVKRSRDPLCPEVCLLTDDAGNPLKKPVRCLTGSVHGRAVLGAAADADLATLFDPSELFAA